ncbi:hypothetical protein [Rhizobium straminoryzae]|uniref:Protein activator of alkane oxidation PraB n=1 Tax=Rhizobium straminoryzae TaxID=1387186 RepID=A0A549T1L0_9HYPH|nr:hypothetical protein [Rhizobium straminoryzae]TRL35767.1 hypothetical protein FNA46_19370 [Rhizobium straminoryzae]
MKSKYFGMLVSVAAALGPLTPVQAQDLKLSALTPQDFAFCLNSEALLVISATSSTETGVVITNVGNSLTNTSGKIVVAANNYYGKGAGGFWTSGMGTFTLAAGSCYNVNSMNKPTPPNPSIPWTCAATTGAASQAGATFTGVISTPTQVTPIATGYALAGVTSTLNNAPVISCPLN